MENKKQEIISWLDDMDEATLDWLLYVIKLTLKKNAINNLSTPQDAKELWDKACELISKEITSVSYKTWIANMIPIGIEKDVLKLAVPSEFHKGLIKSKYEKMIENALFFFTDKKFHLEILIYDVSTPGED